MNLKINIVKKTSIALLVAAIIGSGLAVGLGAGLGVGLKNTQPKNISRFSAQLQVGKVIDDTIPPVPYTEAPFFLPAINSGQTITWTGSMTGPVWSYGIENSDESEAYSYDFIPSDFVSTESDFTSTENSWSFKFTNDSSTSQNLVLGLLFIGNANQVTNVYTAFPD